MTSLGNTWKANLDGFREGRVGVREVQGFDVSRQRVKVAAEVCLSEGIPVSRLHSREVNRIDRGGRMLLWAARECLDQACWGDGFDASLVLGTTSGGMALGERYYREAVGHETVFKRASRGQATRSIYYQAQRQAACVQDAFGLRGPVTIVANACASGANAVGLAWDLIRSGQTDRVLCGGYDALCHLVFAGFDSLQALSPSVCRPFDANRDGLVLGEGAAVFALEARDAAVARGAQVMGEICGYAAATDVHHLTQPHPEGIAALDTMDRACKIAGLVPESIQYINAHGTGTPHNDAAEAVAINRWAGDWASRLMVSSTKANVGHLLGAAGAVEIGVCLMALAGQWVPPMKTCRTLDPSCRFNAVTRPTDAALEYVMSNSFGFGGANASVVMRRG